MASRIHLAAISDRKAFGFREQSPLPVTSSGLPRAHLPFGQFLDLGFCIHAGGFSISPPSNGAWAENVRFDKTIVFSELAFFRLSLQGGFTAAVFVFLARTAATRIVASDFSFCLAI
jgi:hypothetical protein